MMIYKLSYNCPSCDEETTTGLIENLSKKERNKFSDYQIEYKTSDSSDYFGLNVKCRKCEKEIIIPENAIFNSTHLNLKRRSEIKENKSWLGRFRKKYKEEN